MLRVKINNRDLNKKLNNIVKYSDGFVDGAEISKIFLMNKIANFVEESLYRYVDSKARMNPSALHHVYEWNATGSPGARLFDINAVASKTIITINGSFLPSSSISDTATEPFVDKANIMENAISITIAPRNSDFLAFEANGETVFTANEVYIAHPGGDGVAGSFGRVVEEFFDNYFTNMILAPFLQELSTAEEYVQFFAQGARGGYGVGVKAGGKYINSPRMTIQ